MPEEITPLNSFRVKAQCEICGEIWECEPGEVVKFIYGFGDGCIQNEKDRIYLANKG